MTEYGLKIFNNRGEYIIDSLHPTFRYWEHGDAVTASGGANNSHGCVVTFSEPAPGAAMIAIRPDNWISLAYSPVNPTSNIMTSFGVQGASADGPGSTFDWVVYTPQLEPGGEDYGLRCRNKYGKIIYDSSHLPMKLVDVVDVSISKPTGYSMISQTKTHNYAKNPYYSLFPHNQWVYADCLGAPYIYLLIYCCTFLKKINTTSCYVGSGIFATPRLGGCPSANVGFWTAQKLLVYDVELP